ncbi:T9SS type A sorting domain-containing protein [Polaribacter atrinae]|uniref:DUF11 domain-containing protein n=1 Tax=Polaribacter atrinae TaxID=1333662 RepID=A0A176TEC0_9FLAO|nr:T9SS type A sorting domain-containing protein [Polaribacter atrinae]OAD45883.1 hypothetical protein LPB303_06245 [Polaribacter atrinae]
MKNNTFQVCEFGEIQYLLKNKALHLTLLTLLAFSNFFTTNAQDTNDNISFYKKFSGANLTYKQIGNSEIKYNTDPNDTSCSKNDGAATSANLTLPEDALIQAVYIQWFALVKHNRKNIEEYAPLSNSIPITYPDGTTETIYSDKSYRESITSNSTTLRPIYEGQLADITEQVKAKGAGTYKADIILNNDYNALLKACAYSQENVRAWQMLVVYKSPTDESGINQVYVYDGLKNFLNQTIKVPVTDYKVYSGDTAGSISVGSLQGAANLTGEYINVSDNSFSNFPADFSNSGGVSDPAPGANGTNRSAYGGWDIDVMNSNFTPNTTNLNLYAGSKGDLILIDLIVLKIPTGGLVVTKKTTTPNVNIGENGTYEITLTNATNVDLKGIKAKDILPTGFTYVSGANVVLNNARQTATTKPQVGDTTLNWGTFDIDGKGSVTIIFDIAVPENQNLGTYQNGVTATVTSPNDTVITNYDSGDSTNDDITVGNRCDAASSGNLDTDGDGISDICDLDDDNDGILDVDEDTCDIYGTPLLNEDFGIGNNISTPLSGGASTNYNYLELKNPRSNNTSRDLQDDLYAVFNNIPNSASWADDKWQTVGDHTSGNLTPTNDNMLMVNAGKTLDVIYQKTISGITAGALLDVSFWVLNLDVDNNINNDPLRVLPNIQIELWQNGVLLGPPVNTGNIVREEAGSKDAWKYYGTKAPLTTLNSSNITVVIRNNTKAEYGNDLAIDDILVRQLCNTDSDGDGIPNRLDLDSDNDGIPDVIEAGGKDDNNDGMADGVVGTTPSTNGIPQSAGTGNTPTSTDGDGIPDYLDIDADNDGIPDNIEVQTSANYIKPSGKGTNMTDTNKNGIDDNYEINGNVFVPIDTDGDETPDYLDTDSDNDQILDIEENGHPANAILDVNADADGDGLNDLFDNNLDNPNTGFTVNDGFLSPNNKVTNLTSLENSFGDEDNDFNPGNGDLNYRDIKDNDNDGIPDAIDLDDDNDGIPDLIESGSNNPDGDEDGDGIPNYLDTTDNGNAGDGSATNYTDSNNDGIPDVYDTDKDGVPNHFDLDSDNDGIPDIVEAGGEDTDGNGKVDDIKTDDTLKNDANKNGLDDRYDGSEGGNNLTNTDTDGDGIPNSQDLDSDNDGITDVIEAGGSDTNRDGIADNFVDTDNDGFNDLVDGDVGQDGNSENTANALILTGDDANNDGTPDSYPNGDADGDGKLNHLDIDADNDGIPDNIEAQPSIGYIAPSNPNGAMIDVNKNGVDDNYEGSGIGFIPENTDSANDNIPDYLDTDSDNDGVPDIAENGHPANAILDITADTDGDGLNDLFDDNNDPTNTRITVNDGLNPNNKVTNTATLEASFGDIDNDFNPGTGDLDYRDKLEAANVMITQVYQFGSERWIEITNVGSVDIPADNIKIHLYKNTSLNDLTNIEPDASDKVNSVLQVGKSVLFKNSANSIITNLGNADIIQNNDLTEFDGADDIIVLSSADGLYAWAKRYDLVANIANKTSFVRIDESSAPNKTYTEDEWVVFVDDAINSYQSGYGTGDNSTKRHSQDPLISEIKDSNTEANTLLGLHRIEETTTNTDDTWDNGYPDRSRYVVIDKNYTHTDTRLSARKLNVDASAKLTVTDQLLVVTNDIELNGEIRLSGSLAQLIQTHNNTSAVTGNGQLFVDQNSEVPSKYRYNYMSSPVTTLNKATYSLETVLRDGTDLYNPKTINFVSGYDGSYTGTNISLADYWVYTYAPASNGRANWSHKYKNGLIDRGDGYTFKGPGRNQNYTFVGTPNDGEFTTKNITAGQSYLIGNPFPSALNARKFLDDNNDLISTLYFWQHVAETEASGTAGHNFGGYIGGYAAQNVSMATAVKTGEVGPVDYTLEAKHVPDADTDGFKLSLLDIIGTVVSLNDRNFIKFSNIPRGVETLKINYASSFTKTFNIKINNVDKGEFTFPSTGLFYSNITFKLCIPAGSDITFTGTNDNGFLRMNNLTFQDDDGLISCVANSGGSEYANLYKTPEPYIAIGQGFFVEGISTGEIKFNNSQREYKTEGDGKSIFLKSDQKTALKAVNNNLSILKLGMSYSNDEGSNLHRQIGISFNQANSFEYEKGYDSEMYDVNTTDFYWKFPNNNSKYVIAGVQEITNALEVPLELVVNKNSIVLIGIDEINNINQNVYIKDKLTGKTQKINDINAAYQLKEGTYTDRFVLAFEATEDTALSVEEDLLARQTNIYADNKNNKIVISKNQEVYINNVELFDILGKKISLWTIKEQKETYQLEIKKQIPTGIYIVKMNTDKGTINKKVVIE